jgi:hypothetical protein
VTITKRDRYILIAVAALGLVVAFWFLGLAPKRQKLASLDKDLTTAEQTLTQARQEKVQFAQAQVSFPNLYASIGRLGKAVPAGQDTASMLVQLNHAAAKANVNFRSVELKLDILDKLATAAASAAPPATGATGATGPAGAPAAGATGASGAAAAPASTGAATAGAAPTGAGTGALQPLPFQYAFKGNFYSLTNLIHNVTKLVQSRNRQLAVSGRLVVIQGFALTQTKVTIVATSYMLPADQGLFAGATAAGPSGATAATPQPASTPGGSPTTPPTAAVTP